MAQHQTVKEEKSLGDLFSELASETGTLVRQEVTLAQTELTHKAVKVGTNVGYLVVGGAVAYTALFAILAAVIIGLAQIISMVTEWQYMTSAWISAALVGIVVGIVAYVLITGALAKLKTTELTPKETVDTLKEDAQWLKNQVS
jgi:hypothetical protein